MKEPTTNKQENYISTDGLVRIWKTRNPRRWPPHNYPVVLVELIPRAGTRVLALPNSGAQWLPRHTEIFALISQMGLTVSESLIDKPDERRLRFEEVNARRHGRFNG